LAEQRWFFEQDNDCHWYMIPAERRAEWDAWCDIPSDDERAWEAPEFAKRIGGPSSFTFIDPR
jgi:hypothetical protein